MNLSYATTNTACNALVALANSGRRPSMEPTGKRS